MYLPAIATGYAVPLENFNASIHSVFHSAMNLRLPEGGGLLTLVLSNEPDLPQGIRLDSPEGFSFTRFDVGESATCRNGILYFENPHLAVQLIGARRWECDLSRLEIDTRNPAVLTAWNYVWDTLNKRQKCSNAEIIADDLFSPDGTVKGGSVSSKAGKAMQELVSATKYLELAGTVAAETLIGLGSGLTPSGDDLLAGYMAGLWCTVHKKSDWAQFITELGERIIDLSIRTNDISRTYLFHATHGQVSSRLSALAEAICYGEYPDRILGIAESAMQTGNTSGMDAITGLLVGISAWSTSDDIDQKRYSFSF